MFCPDGSDDVMERISTALTRRGRVWDSGRDSPAKGKGHVHTGQRARSLSRPEKMR